MRLSTAHRLFGFSMALMVGLAACSEAESRDDPEDEPFAEGSSEEADDAVDRREADDRDRVSDTRAASVVAAGTPLRFRLTESISTKTHTEGDRFSAVLASDVRADDGSMLIPAGAAAEGRVTRVHKSTGGDDPAILALQLQTVRIGSRPVDLVGRVVTSDVDSDTRDTSGETAAKIAVGAAAGAVLGRVIGKSTEGALIGTGAGAVAGTIVAMSTKGGDATIDQGATITMVVDEPIRVN